MPRRLIVIPARGGSKRIKKKNIKSFCGQPIINLSIDTAIKSNLFEKIHISSEDKEILDFVSKINLKPEFKRPNNQAGDDYPLIPLIKSIYLQFIELGNQYDEIWMLLPCAPLIDSDDLIKASELFSSIKNCRAMMSVSEYPAPIEWAFDLTCNKELQPIDSFSFTTPSQNIKKKYYETGSFCIFTPNFLDKYNGNDSYNEFHGFVLPRYKAVDIDDQSDWDLAEKLYAANKI
jgi:pseudaminic acid cytidylyltransferase